MLRAMFAAALISVGLLSGCSGRHTLDAEELKSSAAEVVSISAEGELLADAIGEHRVPADYGNGHPEYLRNQAEDVVKQLTNDQPDADLQNQCDRLHQAATRLMRTLNALPPISDDPGWQQSRSQFESIRREAEGIRRAL